MKQIHAYCASTLNPANRHFCLKIKPLSTSGSSEMFVSTLSPGDFSSYAKRSEAASLLKGFISREGKKCRHLLAALTVVSPEASKQLFSYFIPPGEQQQKLALWCDPFVFFHFIILLWVFYHRFISRLHNHAQQRMLLLSASPPT